jgi:hypothetical protein
MDVWQNPGKCMGAKKIFIILFDMRCWRCNFSFEQAEQLYNSGSVDEGLRLLSSIGPALGASGAIMGIFAAFGYLFPNTPLYMMFIPIPIKAKWAMIGMAAIDLFGGVANFSGDNVAHFAHLGGAVTGFIIVLIWNKTNRNRFY